MPRLEAEVVDRRLSSRPIGGERIRLPTGPVEREHLLAAEPLAIRVLSDKRVQLGDERRVASELEVGVDPLLERPESQLLEVGPRSDGERLAVEPGQWNVTPERESLVEQLGSARAVPLRARSGTELGKPVEVEGTRLDLEHVTR